MSMLAEFKKFAVKGNMVDMAVGIIIGAAFSGIVKSLVDDIILPPIGLMTGGLDFSDKNYVLKEAIGGQEAIVLQWGHFLTLVINFVIVAFAVFLLVRMINRLRQQEQEKPVSPTEKNCPFCQTSIPVKATRCKACTSEVAADSLA